MQKIFRLRTCEDTVFANRSRPCLLYQIKRCTGPCVGLTDAASYTEDVRSATLFLQGRADEVINRLEQRMQQTAAEQSYEQAAAYRDQIRSLSKVRETQFVSSSRGVDADIVALASAGGLICVNLVVVRGGQHRGDNSFFPQNARDQDEVSCAGSVFGAALRRSRRAAGHHPEPTGRHRCTRATADPAGGDQGAVQQQSCRRAAGMAAHGGKECRTGDRATNRGTRHAGDPVDGFAASPEPGR